MKTINLMDIVNSTLCNTDGFTIYSIISREITNGNKVRLSLHNSTPMSSSFLNSFFGELVDKFGLDKVKDKITLIDYKPYEVAQIKDYLKDLALYSSKKKNIS